MTTSVQCPEKTEKIENLGPNPSNLVQNLAQNLFGFEKYESFLVKAVLTLENEEDDDDEVPHDDDSQLRGNQLCNNEPNWNVVVKERGLRMN